MKYEILNVTFSSPSHEIDMMPTFTFKITNIKKYLPTLIKYINRVHEVKINEPYIVGKVYVRSKGHIDRWNLYLTDTIIFKDTTDMYEFGKKKGTIDYKYHKEIRKFRCELDKNKIQQMMDDYMSTLKYKHEQVEYVTKEFFEHLHKHHTSSTS